MSFQKLEDNTSYNKHSFKRKVCSKKNAHIKEKKEKARATFYTPRN